MFFFSFLLCIWTVKRYRENRTPDPKQMEYTVLNIFPYFRARWIMYPAISDICLLPEKLICWERMNILNILHTLHEHTFCSKLLQLHCIWRLHFLPECRVPDCTTPFRKAHWSCYWTCSISEGFVESLLNLSYKLSCKLILNKNVKEGGSCLSYGVCDISENYCGRGERERRREDFWGLPCFNPFTPELKKCILPTFQKAIVWVM